MFKHHKNGNSFELYHPPRHFLINLVLQIIFFFQIYWESVNHHNCFIWSSHWNSFKRFRFQFANRSLQSAFTWKLTQNNNRNFFCSFFLSQEINKKIFVNWLKGIDRHGRFKSRMCRTKRWSSKSTFWPVNSNNIGCSMCHLTKRYVAQRLWSDSSRTR